MTETEGNSMFCGPSVWTLDCRCFPRRSRGKHRQSRVHKTYCFPEVLVNKYFIIYQSSKLSFPCVLLVESVSREIDEIKLSPSHQRERETMHYSPVNNEKKSRAPSREHATFGPPKAANVFLNSNKINFTALNLPFSTKLIKYFKYFCIKFALSFRFFDSWYIIKYLLTETSGKQYVLWTLDCRCFPRLRLGSTKHTVSLGLSQ